MNFSLPSSQTFVKIALITLLVVALINSVPQLENTIKQ